MKKTVLTLLFAIFTATTLFAQNNSGFRLGLTTSPNFGWLKPDKGENRGTSLGFTYGLLGDFNFASNYSFATGLTITTINGKSTEFDVEPYDDFNMDKSLQHPYDLKYKLRYIDIPLTVKLKTNKKDNLSWYGQFGLSNGFNISAKQDVESPTEAKVKNQNISKYTNFYRAGLILGGGAEFDIDDHTSLTGGLTFNNGFTDIVSGSRSTKNHFIAISLGVFF